jgi:hypothetical protein
MATSFLVLAACNVEQRPQALPSAYDDTCGAGALSPFLGRLADSATRETIRQRVDSRQVRWISPGEPIIADYNSGRLNVRLSEDGRIIGAGCY